MEKYIASTKYNYMTATSASDTADSVMLKKLAFEKRLLCR